MNWESDALLIDVNSIKEINLKWFLLWFWGALGWLRLSLTLLQLLNHIYDTSSFASWQKLKIQKRKSLTVSQKVLPPIEKDCKSKIENLINRILTLLEFREKKRLASLNKISPPPPFQRSLRRWRWTAVVGRWTLRPKKIHGFTNFIFYLFSLFKLCMSYCGRALNAEATSIKL